MKKKLVLGSALALLLSLTAWGTTAYFSTEAHVSNEITTGTINITLNDAMTGAEELEDGSLVLNGVMPGVEVEKVVSVTNKEMDAWIRVIVNTTVIGEDGLEMGNTIDGEPVAQIAFNEQTWVQGQDGCYYYRKPVAQGETTDNLFETVMLNPKLPNAYQNCVVNINVMAQAVQVKNNDQFDSVLDVKGWPKVETPARDEVDEDEQLPTDTDEIDDVEGQQPGDVPSNENTNDNGNQIPNNDIPVQNPDGSVN